MNENNYSENNGNLAFSDQTRQEVKYQAASPFETVNPVEVSESELTIHHLIPQWFAKKYLDQHYPLGAHALSFKEKFFSLFLGHPHDARSVTDWLKSKYNAVLIDQQSHIQYQHYEAAMKLYRDMTIFFLGKDAFLSDLWTSDLIQFQHENRAQSRANYDKEAGFIQRLIPDRLDSLNNFQPLHKVEPKNKTFRDQRLDIDRNTAKINAKLRRFITEQNAQARF